MRVSVLGCGFIGSHVAERIRNGDAGEVQLLSVFDRHAEKAEKVASRLGVEVARSVDEIVNDGRVELVVEVASQEAVKEYGLKILRAKKHILVLSSGAFVDGEFLGEMISVAKANSVKIHVPSGSIVGIDGVKAHALAGISEIVLEYRKNPEDFKEREDAFQKLYNPSAKGAMVLFEGPASEASRLFPRRLNISSTLSMAGVGAEKTKVRVIADPNVHTTALKILIKSVAGETAIQMENLPHKRAVGGYMPVVSTVQKLRDVGATLSLGT